VSEYLESEFLAPISHAQRVFLTRSAVLDRMCGPLCDAVLEQGGSAAILADLAQSNLLLVLLDRRGEWYRYHHLFRDMLRAELHRSDPDLMPILRRAVSSRCAPTRTRPCACSRRKALRARPLRSRKGSHACCLVTSMAVMPRWRMPPASARKSAHPKMS
jgi:ATP/maltotriose-dependent transcriptional regulator MalT